MPAHLLADTTPIPTFSVRRDFSIEISLQHPPIFLLSFTDPCERSCILPQISCSNCDKYRKVTKLHSRLMHM